MKTTALVSLVSAAFIGLGQPIRAGHPGGSPHFGGGVPHFSGPAHFGGGAPHFSGGPHFNGGTPRFSGEGMRFSPSGVRPSPMRPHTFGPNGGFTVQSPRAATTFSRRPGQFGSAARPRATVPGARASTPSGQQAFNGNNRVFARHDGTWHRDWDRGRAHSWRGHWCRFVNGQWLIFDTGFYPYDYYWYGYPYDYYSYDDPDYYGSGASTDPYSASTVSAVQTQLARQGYYHGVIDGVYGPQTRAALTRYQSDHGLQVTGSLTSATLHSLGLLQATSS